MVSLARARGRHDGWRGRKSLPAAPRRHGASGAPRASMCWGCFTDHPKRFALPRPRDNRPRRREPQPCSAVSCSRTSFCIAPRRALYRSPARECPRSAARHRRRPHALVGTRGRAGGTAARRERQPRRPRRARWHPPAAPRSAAGCSCGGLARRSVSSSSVRCDIRPPASRRAHITCSNCRIVGVERLVFKGAPASRRPAAVPLDLHQAQPLAADHLEHIRVRALALQQPKRHAGCRALGERRRAHGAHLPNARRRQPQSWSGVQILLAHRERERVRWEQDGRQPDDGNRRRRGELAAQRGQLAAHKAGDLHAVLGICRVLMRPRGAPLPRVKTRGVKVNGTAPRVGLGVSSDERHRRIMSEKSATHL